MGYGTGSVSTSVSSAIGATEAAAGPGTSYAYG